MKEENQELNDIEVIDKEIEKFLSLYIVENVENEKIHDTIEVLRKYMPSRKEKNPFSFLIRNEVTYINKTYWSFSILMVLVGMLIMNNYNISVYTTLLYISPLPMMLGIFEITRGKMSGVWELEKSLKYSYSKIVLSRIIIIISFTSIINTFLLIVSGYGHTSTTLIKLLTVCIMPICILCSLTLLIMSKISTNRLVMLMSSLWFIFIAREEKNIINLIEKTRDISLLITIIISLIVFIMSIFYFYKSQQKYEGEILWS